MHPFQARHLFQARIVFPAAFAVLALAGCQKSAAPPPVATATQSVAVGVVVTDAARQGLLAAAERFENLTEAAYAQRPDSDAKLALARAEAKHARPLLDSPAQVALDTAMNSVERAASSGQSANLSLASIEIYRLFITAANGSAEVPLPIGLLDYAGFRFQADGRAWPVRWDDMVKAHVFAVEQWNSVKTRIGDAGAARDFDASLAAMDSAVRARDKLAAAKAATRELDLVDVLENSVKQS